MLSSSKTAIQIVVFVATLVCLAAFIKFFADPRSQLPLMLGLFFMYGFAALWYLPHWFANRFRKIATSATTYFFVGAVLISLGCITSVGYSHALKGFQTWQHIGEVMPLIMGAVVGGSYCCDAILGQDFNGNFSQLKIRGALLGVATIVVCLGATMWLYNPRVPFPWWQIIVVACSPLIVVGLLPRIEKNHYFSDGPFWIFLSGSLLVVITGVMSKQLLDIVDINMPVQGGLLDQNQAVSMVKNLVPAYCSAIGAGLILRAMQTNLAPLSLQVWGKDHFPSFVFQSVTGDTITLTKPGAGQSAPQVINVTVSRTVMKALASSAHKREQYGQEASRWLGEELDRTPYRSQGKVDLTIPTASKLGRRIKARA